MRNSTLPFEIVLDYLWDQCDQPHRFGPNVQDFPPNTTGPLLLPSRSRDCAPPPPSLTPVVAAVEAHAPITEPQE